MYKSHVEVEVNEVTADHTGAVEQAYRHDRTEVELFGHMDLVSSVEATSRPGQNLGRQAGKDHVPDGQEYRCDQRVSILRCRMSRMINTHEILYIRISQCTDTWNDHLLTESSIVNQPFVE